MRAENVLRSDRSALQRDMKPCHRSWATPVDRHCSRLLQCPYALTTRAYAHVVPATVTVTGTVSVTVVVVVCVIPPPPVGI